MKTCKKMLLGLLAVSAALASCARDGAAGGEEARLVTMQLNVGTRSPGSDPGTAPDRRVEGDVRLIVYKLNGTLERNVAVGGTMAGDDFTAGHTMEIKTGTYFFAFVANYAHTGLNDDLADENSASIATLDGLRGLAFQRGEFTAAAANGIPMVAFANVSVLGDNDLRVFRPDGSVESVTTAWNVGLERAGVKLELKLELTEQQYTAWIDGGSVIELLNVPKSAYLLPGRDNTAGADGFDLSDGIEATGTGTRVLKGTWILPELFFDPATSDTEAMEFRMEFDYGGGTVDTKTAKVYHKEVGGDVYYAIPRNTWLVLGAKVMERIEITGGTLVDWDDGVSFTEDLF